MIVFFLSFDRDMRYKERNAVPSVPLTLLFSSSPTAILAALLLPLMIGSLGRFSNTLTMLALTSTAPCSLLQYPSCSKNFSSVQGNTSWQHQMYSGALPDGERA